MNDIKLETQKVTQKQPIVSFPHMGNYYSVIYSLLSRVMPNAKIMMAPKITKYTMELGQKYSPDFVCTPFKYTLGSFIEALEKGATVLIQAGGGCKFGYYAELQEQILRDLGYDFIFISLLDAKQVTIPKVYRKIKQINPHLNLRKFSYDFILTVRAINYLDELEDYIRNNIAFEVKKGEFDQIHKQLLKEMILLKNFVALKKIKLKYMKLLKDVKLDKTKSKLKVGIVGELYDTMEPVANFFLEKELANMSIETRRYITVTYLLFEKGKNEKNLLKKSNKYIKYALGADGTESVAHTLEMCKENFDGIIHVKPFGCTPEINAIPILQKISSEYSIPIIYFTFDLQTSETGIKTRLEAFYDMMLMKKEANLND